VIAFWKANLHNFDRNRFGAPLDDSYEIRAMSQTKRSLCTTTFPVSRATAIKLAWAIALAQCSGSNDVCFVYSTWGRDVPVANVEKMTGPTFDSYPCRVRLPAEYTMSQMLSDFQEQTHRTMEYQNYGLKNIACISAAAAEACATSIQLTIQPPPPTGLSKLMVEFEKSHRQDEGIAFDVYAFDMQVTLESQTSLRAFMDYDEIVLPTAQAEALVTRFADALCLLQDTNVLNSRHIADFLGRGSAI
jgi:non-ribosomal peptide synthetase component F